MNLRPSAAEAVTNQIRREILNGTIVAGSRILPKALAEQYAVSVVPVREALLRLEVEGLVATSPQRATFASEVGIEDLAGVYDLRRVVEGEFAFRSAGVATDLDLQTCDAALTALQLSMPYSEEFFRAHRTFHWTLLAPAASDVTRTTLERLWQSVDRYMALAAKASPEAHDADYISNFHAEHAAIAAAFAAGDGAILRELLVSHLTSTERRLKCHCKNLIKRLPANS